MHNETTNKQNKTRGKQSNTVEKYKRMNITDNNNNKQTGQNGDNKNTRTHPQNDKVEESVNACALEFRLARVHHEFGVLAGEDDNTIAPLGVAQDAATQQDLVIVQGEAVVGRGGGMCAKVKVDVYCV